MIYFIQSADGTGPIKIGFAVDPQKRIAEIQRMSPTRLRTLATIDGDRATESVLHRGFSHLRAYGEWFRPEQELLDFIADPSQGVPTRNPLKVVKPASSKSQLGNILARQGMSVYALAKRIDMPHHNIKKIVDSETISGNIQYKTLRSIVNALGIKFSDLEA